jgi:hypothetical protein
MINSSAIHREKSTMTDADSSDLQAIRIDGNFRQSLPEDVRWAVTLLTAYLDGLTDGQRRLRSSVAQAAAASSSQEPPSGPAGGDGRTQLEGHAEAVLAAEAQNPTAVLAPASLCGTISGAPMPETQFPDPAPAGSTSGRDVVLVWGPGAYSAVRRSLP